jgi:integrase
LIRVEESKSGQKRDIPIHPEVAKILDSLPRDCEYVFSYKKRRVKEDSLKNAFVRLIRRINRQNPMTPIVDFHFHDLRHTFAHDYLAAGGKLGVLRELLGHSKIETTMVYASWSEEFASDSIFRMPDLPDYHNAITLETEGEQNQKEVIDYQPSAVSSVG